MEGDGLGMGEKIEASQVVDFRPRAVQEFGAVNHQATLSVDGREEVRILNWRTGQLLGTVALPRKP